jgi:flagellar biosynthesis/type III secretory pathway M-ring protein FliF/YscJ
MSQRTSAILWLIIALFCGFLSLVACTGGGYGIWHTHSKVKLLEQSIEEDERELKDTKKIVRGARFEELENRLRESDKEKAEFERYRVFAIAGAAISVIPGLMTLAFLGLAVAKFMKKSRPAPEDDEEFEEEEEPAEKKSTPKAKAKSKENDG